MGFLAEVHHGWWWIFPIFWFVWLFVIAFLVWGRGAGWRRHPGHWDGRTSGEGVLAERYARGEIDEAEYRRRLAVLRERTR
jgi:putative membrane protein